MKNELTNIVSYAKNQNLIPYVIRKNVFWPIQTEMINPATLYFGQQHVNTVDLFTQPYHTVPITELPHRKCLSGDEDVYRKYIRYSWDYYSKENTVESRENQVENFRTLLSDIEKNGINTPIRYMTRPDGKRIIFSGTHRSSIAHYLGIDVPAVEMSIKEFVLKNSQISAKFYGKELNRLPPQSIYQNGREIVSGRRKDIKSRLELVDETDLKDSRILDLGCKIGSSAFIAAEKGAKKVVGIDCDPILVTSAIRLNVVFALPCEFVQTDLSGEIEIEAKFDTCFCFSIDRDVDDDEQLAENVHNNVTGTLYFETHPNSTVPSEIKELSNTIEFKGHTGIDNNRKLFKLSL